MAGVLDFGFLRGALGVLGAVMGCVDSAFVSKVVGIVTHSLVELGQMRELACLRCRRLGVSA
ncbi:MAG: hypothetical protein ACRESL_16860, partial [Pseudomonas sp.]